MEETKPMTLTAAAAATVPAIQVPASSKVAPVVLPGGPPVAAPAVVPAPVKK